jgi:hypothetical protein
MQPGVFVSALGTLAEFGSGGSRVQRIATDTVKTGFASLQFKAPVVAPVIVQPKTKENRCDKEAVENSAGGKLEHSG